MSIENTKISELIASMNIKNVEIDD